MREKIEKSMLILGAFNLTVATTGITSRGKSVKI